MPVKTAFITPGVLRSPGSEITIRDNSEITIRDITAPCIHMGWKWMEDLILGLTRKGVSESPAVMLLRKSSEWSSLGNYTFSWGGANIPCLQGTLKNTFLGVSPNEWTWIGVSVDLLRFAFLISYIFFVLRCFAFHCFALWIYLCWVALKYVSKMHFNGIYT